MNIYVGNLAYTVTDDDLQNAFAEFGEVTSAKVIMDKATGRSKGFGFVEMSNDSDAKKAIESINDQDLKGRKVRVNEAKPREDKPQGSRPRRY